MMELLTREQVEHIAAQLSESTRVLSFPCSQVIAGWLLTDAALRAQLAAMTETAKEAEASAIIERADRINAQVQLTAMTERADENQRKYETQCVGTKSRLEEIQRLNCVVVAQQQEIERLKLDYALLSDDYQRLREGTKEGAG